MKYRIVRNAQRKRKLKKRGEHIYWSAEHNAWIWWPTTWEDYETAVIRASAVAMNVPVKMLMGPYRDQPGDFSHTIYLGA